MEWGDPQRSGEDLAMRCRGARLRCVIGARPVLPPGDRHSYQPQLDTVKSQKSGAFSYDARDYSEGACLFVGTGNDTEAVSSVLEITKGLQRIYRIG